MFTGGTGFWPMANSFLECPFFFVQVAGYILRENSQDWRWGFPKVAIWSKPKPEEECNSSLDQKGALISKRIRKCLTKGGGSF